MYQLRSENSSVLSYKTEHINRESVALDVGLALISIGMLYKIEMIRIIIITLRAQLP